MRHEIYARHLKLYGEDHINSLREAVCYTTALVTCGRFEEARSLMRKRTPAAQRVLGESHDLTLRMWFVYARALVEDPTATLDDLREAVTTLEPAQRTARRVFGGKYPLTQSIELVLRNARVVLRARETPSTNV